MTKTLNRIALAAILTGPAGLAQAQAPEPPEAVNNSLGVDGTAEAQRQRDELEQQWEADARAAGIDPDTATAQPQGNSQPKTSNPSGTN